MKAGGPAKQAPASGPTSSGVCDGPVPVAADGSSTNPAAAERHHNPAGRNRIRRFTVVGIVVTALDFALLLWLVVGRQSSAFYSDLISVGVATAASFILHRAVTMARHPVRRWFTEFGGSYASAVAGSYAVDVVVFTVAADALGAASLISTSAAKALALAAAVAVRSAAYRSVLRQAVRAEQRSPQEAVIESNGPRLSVVVPAFKERDRIAATIDQIRSELEPVLGLGQVEVVVVDDGSEDGTLTAAERAGANRVVALPENRGKGAAVRAGMLAATGQTLAFLDADLAYRPSQLLTLLERTEAGWDVVVGSRKHHSATTLVRAGRLREIGSRVVNLLTSLVLLGQYRDTQCGCKAFRAHAARRLFEHTKIDRFAMDIELLYLVERYRMTLAEVPVEVANSERSSVRVVADTARLVRDLARIRVLARNGDYDAEVCTDQGSETEPEATPHTDGELRSAPSQERSAAGRTTHLGVEDFSTPQASADVRMTR